MTSEDEAPEEEPDHAQQAGLQDPTAGRARTVDLGEDLRPHQVAPAALGLGNRPPGGGPQRGGFGRGHASTASRSREWSAATTSATASPPVTFKKMSSR